MKPTYEQDGFEIHSGFRIRRTNAKKGFKYQVDLGTRSGKHVRKQFSAKSDAEQFARDSRIEAMNHKVEVHAFTDRQREDAVEALKILEKHGVDLRCAAHYYDRHHQAIDSNNGVKFLVAEFLGIQKERYEKGTFSFDSYKNTKLYNGNFANQFGNMAVDTIRPNDLDAWFDIKTNGWTTRSSYYRYLSTFFNWCIKNKRGGVVENPIKECTPIPEGKKPTKIYTPQEVQKIINSAVEWAGEVTPRIVEDKTPIITYMVLGFWLGIRPDEILRLSWDDIDLEVGEVLVSDEAVKTGDSRYVTIPENAKEWLMKYRGKGMVFPHSKERRRSWRDKVMEKAEIKHLQDGARHSYATYGIALNGIDDTMENMGHNVTRTLLKHYKGLAKNRKEQANKYFDIRPIAGKIIPMQKSA